MRSAIAVIRLGVGLAVLAAALPAVAALFGSAVPWFDLFNHLQLPLFLALLIGTGLAVLLFRGSRWRRPVLLAGLAGLAASGVVFVPELVASLATRPPLPGDGRPVLKAMTHNVFGLNYDMAQVSAVIAAEDPDIIVLQEYFGEQASALHPLLADRYRYSVRCRGGKRANLGLYAKLPFELGMTPADCPDNAYGTQRTAHILAHFAPPGGAAFSVLTSHMDWPLPTQRQQDQMTALASTAKAVTGPLIVLGDFNSTPWSHGLRHFAATASLQRQDHNLVTYPLLFTVPRRIARDNLIETIPFLPLDHVFTRDGIAVHDLHAAAATGSDHVPVVFSFSVADEPEQAPGD